MNERKWLLDIRKKMGATQQEIADKAGITRAYYAAIEAGTRVGRVNILMKIANVMEFDWTIFFATQRNKPFQKKEAMQQ